MTVGLEAGVVSLGASPGVELKPLVDDVVLFVPNAHVGGSVEVGHWGDFVAERISGCDTVFVKAARAKSM